MGLESLDESHLPECCQPSSGHSRGIEVKVGYLVSRKYSVLMKIEEDIDIALGDAVSYR